MSDQLTQIDDEVLLARYASAFDRGDLPAARAAAEEFVRRHPGDPGAWRRLGDACYGPDMPRAIEAFGRARQLDPDDADALWGLAYSLMHATRLEEACTAALELVATTPTAPHYTMLASVQWRLGRMTDAEASLEMALDIDPEDDEALYFYARCLWGQDGPSALAVARELLRLHPSYAPGRAFYGWLCVTDLDDLFAAEMHLRAALDLDPTGSEAWHWLARVLEVQDDTVGARAAAQRACELAPEDWSCLLTLGRILESDEDDEGAERCYRQAVEDMPAAACAVRRLARFLIERDRAAEARVLVEQQVAAEHAAEA